MTSITTGPSRSTLLRRRPSTWVALVLLALALAMIVFLIVANAAPDTARLPNRTGGFAEVLQIGLTTLAWLCMLGAGAALAILRPRNAIGWLLLLGGSATVFTYFAEDYVARATVLAWSLPGYAAVDWIVPLFATLSGVLIALWVPLLFPTGHLPGRRWRPVAVAIGVVIAADVLLRLFIDDHLDPWGRALPNPVALGGEAEMLAKALIGVTTFGLLTAIVLAFLSLIIRFTRAAGTERQQFKWVLASIALVFVTSVGMASTFALGTEGAELFWLANQLSIGLPPIAIGIAVLRYRLYEIDRIISRTIGWAVVTLLLVGAFAGLVLGSSAILDPITGGNTLAVAGSTLVVAALFAPLRGRVQRAVDRRFDRARYDGERLLGGFGERLRDEVDREAIRADVLGTVDAAVRPASVGLWLREGARER